MAVGLELQRMHIAFIGSSTCPNTPLLRENLRQAIKLLDAQLIVEYLDQNHLPEDDIRRGYPTPTILLDGLRPV